jgi:hypothetical protein
MCCSPNLGVNMEIVKSWFVNQVLVGHIIKKFGYEYPFCFVSLPSSAFLITSWRIAWYIDDSSLALMEPMLQNKLWIYIFLLVPCVAHNSFVDLTMHYLLLSIFLQTQFYAPRSPYFITLIFFPMAFKMLSLSGILKGWQ